jgi:hypothetical protein
MIIHLYELVSNNGSNKLCLGPSNMTYLLNGLYASASQLSTNNLSNKSVSCRVKVDP